MRLFLSLLLLAAVPSFGLSRDTLFVALGGYLSCNDGQPGAPNPYGIGLYGPLESLMKKAAREAERGVSIKYIVTCFNSDAPPQGSMEFVTSEKPDETQRGNGHRIQSEIERMAKTLDHPAVHVIGHSYGGWLSMYLMERLKLVDKVVSLSTVDPISTACGPFQYIFGTQECKQAPKDRNNRKILESVGTWINFYQTADGKLHSSSIPEAKNFFLSYRGPHSDIDSDERTWAEIEAVVLAPAPAIGENAE